MIKKHTIPKKMSTMNYKKAAVAPTSCPKSYVSNDREQNNEEYLKMLEREEFQKRANIQMNKIVNRFLKYKREELELDGYDAEEIESIIDCLLNPENEEYDEYSSNEDDDSVYSDEDTF